MTRFNNNGTDALNWKHFLTRRVSDVSAAVRYFSPPKLGLRVLMYHAIGSPALGDRQGIFSISPSLFEQHMALLAGYSSALTQDFGLIIPVKELRVAVTFDDGYADNLRVAVPILEKYGIPFTVFVSTAFVRNNTAHFLCSTDLKELARHPLAKIGSHGSTHVPLTKCDDRQLREEIVGSKDYLEDVTGIEVNTLSYPFGAANLRVRDAVDKAGYQSAVSSYSDINRVGRDPLLLCRTAILGGDSPHIFQQKLHGDWDWYKWLQQNPASF